MDNHDPPSRPYSRMEAPNGSIRMIRILFLSKSLKGDRSEDENECYPLSIFLLTSRYQKRVWSLWDIRHPVFPSLFGWLSRIYTCFDEVRQEPLLVSPFCFVTGFVRIYWTSSIPRSAQLRIELRDTLASQRGCFFAPKILARDLKIEVVDYVNGDSNDCPCCDL